MKHMKKFASLLLAMMMVMALAVPAMAAEEITYKVVPVVGGTDSHNFTVYQIFKANEADGSSLDAETVAWGDYLKQDAFVEFLKTNYGTVFTDENTGTAQEVAEALADATSGENKKIDGQAFANAFGAAVKANADKYFTRASVVGSDEAPDVYTGWVLVIDQVTNSSAEPTFMVKQLTSSVLNESGVLEITAKEGKPGVKKEVATKNPEGWSNAAIYPTDEEFEFKLTATLPDNYDTKYHTNGSNYTLNFHDRHAAGLTVIDGSFEVKLYKADGSYAEDLAFTVLTGDALANDKDHNDGDHEACNFVVRVSGLETYTNSESRGKVVVTYKAKLTGDNVDFTNVGNLNSVWLGAPESEETEDEVKVYSLELDINKVNGDKVALNGAKFLLEKKTDRTNEDGTPVYEIVGTDADGIEGTTPTGGTAANRFTWKGLEPGEYRLTETKEPTGYNKLKDPIEFKIEASTPGDGTLNVVASATGNSKITFGDNNGIPTADVVNLTGIELPSTGGIGTTIFYVLGGLLVAGAVILLVTKRRMSAAED